MLCNGNGDINKITKMLTVLITIITITDTVIDNVFVTKALSNTYDDFLYRILMAGRRCTQQPTGLSAKPARFCAKTTPTWISKTT